MPHPEPFEGRAPGGDPDEDGPDLETGSGLLAEVDFKWLMAGHGWDIDMARLGTDAAYTANMLDWAMQSDSPALRACAARLRLQVGGTASGDKS